MADLSVGAVTIHRAWSEGGVTGKELSCRLVSLNLTGQGTTANKITAAVLQLTKIEQASIFSSDDDTTLVPAAPSGDGTYLLLADLTQAVDVDRSSPADFSGVVLKGTVKGYL